MVVGRRHCSSWIARSRWRNPASSSRQTVEVCASPKYAIQPNRYRRKPVSIKLAAFVEAIKLPDLYERS